MASELADASLATPHTFKQAILMTAVLSSSIICRFSFIKSRRCIAQPLYFLEGLPAFVYLPRWLQAVHLWVKDTRGFMEGLGLYFPGLAVVTLPFKSAPSIPLHRAAFLKWDSDTEQTTN